jgi:deferrochelatase/peroxidase EfeB
MDTQLDLDDIQGNVVKAYGRYGFPFARYLFFRVTQPACGREFVKQILPLITTSVPWPDPSKTPLAATNIAFTYQGLRRLEVPQVTLHGFPDEFSMGMKARRDIIGDTGPNHFCRWDPIWDNNADKEQIVHIVVTIDGKSEAALEARYDEVLRVLAAARPGVEQLPGHRGIVGDERREDLLFQPAHAIPPKPNEWGYPGGKEHFGYSDGISTTYFAGCGEDPDLVIGGGKPVKGDPKTREGWAPLEPGEFVFGHRDEAFEYPEAPGPPLFSRNGTFMVYRKLHENVGSFNSYLEAEGVRFPGGKEALAAKFAGRWRNGAPLTTFETEEKANRYITRMAALQVKAGQRQATPAEKAELAELNRQLVAYDYDDDAQGSKCPFGAHIRRANPRSALRFGNQKAFDEPGALTNRRRILRRGLPYGQVDDATRDDGDHGVIMMIINADLSRQFEFVQQQWFNFGNDFGLANDQDPFLGNHGINDKCRGEGRMVIEGDQETKPPQPPYFCGHMPTLVETRGGDYFFVPSLTCLRMLGLGIIDPT